MTIDTKRLATDAAYWDEVAGTATHYCPSNRQFYDSRLHPCCIPRPQSELVDGLQKAEASLEAHRWGVKAAEDYIQSKCDYFFVQSLPSSRESIGGRACAEPSTEREGGPDAYACPALCGCLWRDNEDGTMSLYGPNSRSCNICEPMRLDELTPVQFGRNRYRRDRDEISDLIHSYLGPECNIDAATDAILSRYTLEPKP